jgi:hypothetical protein
MNAEKSPSKWLHEKRAKNMHAKARQNNCTKSAPKALMPKLAKMAAQKAPKWVHKKTRQNAGNLRLATCYTEAIPYFYKTTYLNYTQYKKCSLSFNTVLFCSKL